jgi:hypothetical protein
VDPQVDETKAMMAEILKLTRENNEILVKVRNGQRWAQISKALYWLVILGIGFGSFYFIQPYLNSLTSSYSSVFGSSDSSKKDGSGSLSDLNHLQDLLKQVGSSELAN